MHIECEKLDLTNLKCDVKVIGEINEDFIILDDNTPVCAGMLNKIIEIINSYGYNAKIIYLENLINEALREYEKYSNALNIDLIMTVGDGGKRTFDYIKNRACFENIPVFNLFWSRKWDGDISKKFITNIEEVELKGKNILLIEDVIASGETLFNICNYIKTKGAFTKIILAGMINEVSPIINKSFIDTIVGSKVIANNISSEDAFWYPPIYSLRHLIWGDYEMKDFYTSLNKRYFNNEDVVEKFIKQNRKVGGCENGK